MRGRRTRAVGAGYVLSAALVACLAAAPALRRELLPKLANDSFFGTSLKDASARGDARRTAPSRPCGGWPHGLPAHSSAVTADSRWACLPRDGWACLLRVPWRQVPAAGGEAEDLLVALAAQRACPGVEVVEWGVSVHHNLDGGPGKDHRAYAALEHECLARLNVSARDALQLTTGTASPWGTPETLGPMSAIVHRVGSARQWRHAAALADHWSSRIEALGRPECFYPWQWTNLA